MKIKSLLIGMLASTAFVACTNEDDVINNEQAVVGGEKQYVAVNLVMPSDATNRAVNDDEFAKGSEDENTVSKAVFLFFNEKFEGCAAPCVVENLELDDATKAHQDKKATVLVIENGDKQVPAYIAAVINPTKDYTATTKLSDLQGEQLAYASSNYTKKGTFVMTNAVYKGEQNLPVIATPITIDHVKSNQTDAIGNPVQIQVERVVARVDVKNLATASWNHGKDDNGNQITETYTDGSALNLTLQVNGWQVLQNQKSNLIKNVDVTWTHNWWNDLARQRSYWANDYATGGRQAFTVAQMTMTDSKYVEETVSQTPNTDEGNKVNPYLLVTGQFVQTDAEGEVVVDENGHPVPVQLVEWRGEKYTEESYLNFIATNPGLSKYWYKDGETWKQFNADLLEMVATDEHDWEAVAALEDESTQFYTVTLKVENGKNIVTGHKAVESVKTVTDEIEKFGKVQYWKNGHTYYYVPIEHQKVSNDIYYGVVRNHVYELTINGITGFGTAVANPEQAIDEPEKPTDDASYLAADVVVLKWRVVKQSVTLGE